MTDSLKAAPLVSVVIPAYNAADYVGETLESIFAQTLTDFEVIVVNNGSTDDTVARIEEFTDPRLRLISQEGSGSPAGPRNRGMREACGEFIAFVDTDDLWHPKKLERQVEYLKKHDECALVFTLLRRIDERGRVMSDQSFPTMEENCPNPGHLLERLAGNSFICNSSTMLRTRVVREIGELNESPLHRGTEDFDYWLRISRDYPIGWVAEVLVDYRVHAGAFSQQKVMMNRGGFLAVQRQWENRGDHTGDILENAMNDWAFRWRFAEALFGDSKSRQAARSETQSSELGAARRFALALAEVFPRTVQRIVDLRRKLNDGQR